MKSLKKIIALLMSAGIISLAANAQDNTYSQTHPSTGYDYNTAIGARLGGLTSGLTIKHFTNPTTALEGILSFGHRSFVVTGLYEKHYDIASSEGLKWLYGIGGHVGFFRYGGYYRWVAYDDGGRVYYVSAPGNTAAVAGIDFILGLDYKFPNAPFNLGLDIKPFVDFYNGANGFFDGALSVRFAF
jgi:hypothetical protein